MIAMTSTQWLLLAVLVVLYVGTSVRVAMQVRRTGRNALLWFFITLFLTAIPAAVLLLWHNSAWLRRREASKDQPADQEAGAAGGGPMVRCPRCRRLFDASREQGPGPVKTCPRCGLPLDEEGLA